MTSWDGQPSIITFTGILFDLENPTPNMVTIRDIAHALSLKCRWGGHCHYFYSVAEHSIEVSKRVPEEHKLEALMHDSEEAYLVDLPRPLKRAFPEYKVWKDRVRAVIFEKFNLTLPLHASIKAADNLELEHDRLTMTSLYGVHSTHAVWPKLNALREDYHQDPRREQPSYMEEKFIRIFENLMRQRNTRDNT